MKWEDLPVGSLFIWDRDENWRSNFYKYLRKVGPKTGLFMRTYNNYNDISERNTTAYQWDSILESNPFWVLK